MGEKTRRTPEQKLRRLRTTLRQIMAYPRKGHPHRTKDGYPTEIIYDEFAYQRIVDSFRKAIQSALDESKG